jgi:DNA replication protein DnaC
MKAMETGDLMPEIKMPVVLPEADFDCPRHGKYRGAPIKTFGFPGKETHIIAPECPECKRGETRREREKAELEKKERLVNNYKRMNIGKKFWDESFETFDAYTDELKKHLATARKFAEKPEGKLVMLGEHGNGKNHLAASILKTTGGLIYRAYEIGLLLRQAINGTTTEYDVLARLCKTPLLDIDEIEKLKDSEAKNHWLSYVVGKRYDDMLPVIFIGNCHTQDDCRAGQRPCPQCIEYHLENDILSRIIEDGIIMKFTGEDYRYKKRAERAGGNNA